MALSLSHLEASYLAANGFDFDLVALSVPSLASKIHFFLLTKWNLHSHLGGPQDPQDASSTNSLQLLLNPVAGSGERPPCPRSVCCTSPLGNMTFYPHAVIRTVEP